MHDRQDWQQLNARPGLALLKHQRRLTSRFAARLGRSDAEDLASEAIARGLARPAPDGRQEPWIETIFRNLLTDAHRHLGRRGGRAEAMVDEPVDRGASPEDVLLRRERGHAVASAMPAIPTELREALVARFYDDQDYDQMAASSGISVTTARTRVWRALARLRQSLQSMRAWLPGTFGSGTPLAAAWLPAVAVAVLAIGPSIDGGGERVPTSEVIIGSESRPVRVFRAAAPHPTITVATTTRPRNVSPERAVTHAAKAVPAADNGTTAEEEEVKPLPVQRFDFDGEEVLGDRQQPGILLVNGTPREAKLDSLIEIPRSFVPSMTKMIEDN